MGDQYLTQMDSSRFYIQEPVQNQNFSDSSLIRSRYHHFLRGLGETYMRIVFFRDYCQIPALKKLAHVLCLNPFFPLVHGTRVLCCSSHCSGKLYQLVRDSFLDKTRGVKESAVYQYGSKQLKRNFFYRFSHMF